MQRREFITLVAAAVAWPIAARAQERALPVIGYLSARSRDSDVAMVSAFQQSLKEAGFSEGVNVAIEYRWGDGQYDRLPAMAEDLVRRNVATIVTSGGEIAALAAKAATTRIPIVFNMKPVAWMKTPKPPSYCWDQIQDRCDGADGWSTGSGDRVSKGGAEKRTAAAKRNYIRHCRPDGISIAEGCRLMRISRSTFYDTPAVQASAPVFTR